MTVSKSKFLFEATLQNVKSLVNTKQLFVKLDFAGVFSLSLRCGKSIMMPRPFHPPSKPPGNNKNENGPRKPKQNKGRKENILVAEPRPPTLDRFEQSALIPGNAEYLLAVMKEKTLDLSLWSKKKTLSLIGSTKIAWDNKVVDFLVTLCNNNEAEKFVTVNNDYNIFNEKTAKLMATVTIQVKLTYLNDIITSEIRNIPDTNTGKNINNCHRASSLCSEQNKPEDCYNLMQLQKIKEKNEKSREAVLRNYVNKLKLAVENNNINLHEMVRPCGRQTCMLTELIQNLVKQEINFKNPKSHSPYMTQKEINYCVGYCTVVHDKDPAAPNSDESLHPYCKSDCPSIAGSHGSSGCPRSRCATPSESISCVQCPTGVTCSQMPRDSILSDIEINMEDIKKPCCVESESLKVNKTLDYGTRVSVNSNDPCYCDCECKFTMEKNTTYCSVCGGYEEAGSDLKIKSPNAMPTPPCPIYHKLYDKNKNKYKVILDPAASDVKKKPSIENVSRRSKASDHASTVDGGSGVKLASPASSIKSHTTEKKTAEKKSSRTSQNTDQTKHKVKRKVRRFTFNYGFTGIPAHIGHSLCHLPHNAKDIPTGNLNVPRNMGWLWTSRDVPGLKYRPDWRPGAANKKIVNLVMSHKSTDDAMPRKKQKRQKDRARLLKSKGKVEKKPLLTVHKKDGEYKVTMETLKNYNKPRIVNQCPYEDKAPQTYLVGRTHEENLKRQKRQEQRQRRLEREKRRYIQQSFKNACKEVCMTAYRKALGIQESDETPDCRCFPLQPDLISVDAVCSCSCSETSSSGDSETDRDEWTVEFTPPVAKYDPSYKVPGPVKHHTATQYSYLDYRVKLMDMHGKPVPRFFRGPDGKEVCSDLGGFYGPDGKWLEIGVDGYIGPDGRWVPNTFIGPDGQIIDASTGKFQGPDGEWLVIGVDGYIDSQGRWVYVPPRPSPPASLVYRRPSVSTWSCFGDVTPTTLADKGIVGHSRDRQLLVERLKKLQAEGAPVKIPTPSVVPKSPYRPNKPPKKRDWSARYKCRHPEPSSKGILSIDSEGKKTYFKLPTKDYRMSTTRVKSLEEQGFNICQYHEHCYGSFIGCKELKQLLELARQGSNFPSKTRKMSGDKTTTDIVQRPVLSSAGDAAPAVDFSVPPHPASAGKRFRATM